MSALAGSKPEDHLIQPLTNRGYESKKSQPASHFERTLRAGLPGPIENSAVFAGFGAKALGDRIRASGSRLVFTADVTYRKATIEDEGSVEEARHA